MDNSLKRRDAIDSTRKAAPLRVAPDAVVIDSTSQSIEDVVTIVLQAVKSASANGGGAS